MKSENTIVFKKATTSDLEELNHMFISAINSMENQQVFQWDTIYPNKAILSDDIAKGQMYIGLIKDEICSAFVINQEEDGAYKNGRWTYNDSNYRVIHRLCVNPKYQNIGVGKQTMKYIENTLLENEVIAVRLDVFKDNPFAIRLYKNLGYNEVGLAIWRKGTFYLMEKILKTHFTIE